MNKSVAQIKQEIEEFVKERERREQETFGRRSERARGRRPNKYNYIREGRVIKRERINEQEHS